MMESLLINDLAAAAQRLRHVKAATRQFMRLGNLAHELARVQAGDSDASGASKTVGGARDDVSTSTAVIEAAIRALDVYDCPALVRGVLGND